VSNKAYTGTSRDQARFAVGFVKTYDPDRRLYAVDVYGKGETPCSQIDSGILKPYPIGSRVMMAQFPGSNWVVVGEVPKTAASPSIEITSTEETLATSRGRLQNNTNPLKQFLPYYRQVDTTGESDAPVFEGDARLENRTDKSVARSFLHIFKFGDILARSSAACYIHLSKLRSTIIMKGRDLRERFAGYNRDVVTPSHGSLSNLTTVTDEYRANPLALTADLTYRWGAMENGLVGIGSEVTFLGGYQHIELPIGTLRTRTSNNFVIAGSLLNSTSTGQVLDLPFPAVGTGVSLQTTKGQLTVREDVNSITVALPGTLGTISITDGAIAVVRQAQSFVISDVGIEINATNLVINVAGNTAITTAGSLNLTGATIDLN